MQFGRRSTGRMLEYPAGLDAATVRARCALPSSIEGAPSFEAWLRQVEEAAGMVREMVQDQPVETLGVQAQWLDELGQAAHRMRNALAVLSASGDRAALFELLQPLGDYVLWRARDGIGAVAGRPSVPVVDTDAANFAHLMTRMVADLQALRAIADHLGAKLTDLPSSMPKHHQRQLVKWCALSFQAAFGRLPPKRGWFGDAFMPYVGECIGLQIGHRIVGEVVTALAADPDAA